MKTLKYLLLLVFCVPLVVYGQNNSSRLFKTKIVYQKSKHIFAKSKYIMFDVALGGTAWKFQTYHGVIAGIYYADSSALYYWNDSYVMPPNKSNYQTINFVPMPGWCMADTVISGLQTNGKYWKEKFISKYNNEKLIYQYWIGYKDVPQEKVKLFDKSLDSFRRDK